MLKALQLILSIVTVGLALYIMLTYSYQFLSFLNILLGLTMLVLGAIEWKKRKKTSTWLLFLVALVSWFVGIYCMTI
ncbi:YczI family protein [Priestia megaterium]|uniref:YczI family protein n=1 Tax=Priestia megaterium TaxID=1404 RepID=UPI0013E2A95B|nr:YczI family protein [Priestia megaterium]MED3863302.1 YczI family protein [Priestia megaterium]MED4101745.1 YczI family protein [Priestia megaterium]MED4145667.1 YczI family protein [Priestia megaterium]MED4166488.1 YczI family protein [Priestia megaterium]MED4199678.1 YczI family protein [Priestia megaterium]